jgi:hypothetical protein
MHYTRLRQIICRIPQLFATSRHFTVGVLAPGSIPKLKCYPLSAVRNRIQHIRLYPQNLEAVSSIGNIRTRHSLVTRKTPKM